ncbi:MAG: MotA/TolQ/ExbB proton channel family protein [Gemmatimonadetes bacterium]|uniref:MotA/TolQ/ExbB proton channel family protein n=1 Tax=Candidatus Kutchimonas denitrificans TaxID=3056748 RepID=A0AAE5C9B0_9BACT|nr:MotA/TolQ/ExbB proton channel family protein [Gemmatimonadota bacterium]NIR75301.1 MotA/TolQ/ExbB proton channel family protein [Candidatus Kutchimonas denitrificans]NIS02127.1 MotA/TolQ/ExbB proton channel family protein [Gemmatimonadota bacterium]NIT67952.1 MotA/TolQ/ExbB proton channel family protein [Gemmatimonadota bacterium]NIU53946.1 MotA/TolQ/ExbB proton channel family protein [Gemmatimonadota bacterium]
MGGITLSAFMVAQALGQGQRLDPVQTFKDGGFMMWPLAFFALAGLVIIIIKFIDLKVKGGRNRTLLDETDQLLAEHRIDEAVRRCQESKAPAASILLAGLRRREEGTERVMKAIENAGLIELAGLERGLVWLATLANVAPLTGFLGTVIGMIQAFQAIEIAGEVEATTVAGGIKVALITTASGLTIAIPINIAHNYFVTEIDRLVIEMEESAQKMIDALHEIESRTTTV